MKLLMGFIVLLVALVAVTGCTQQTATPATETTTETAVPTTEVTTLAPTTIETTVPVTTETIVANMTAPAANVTATANVTTVETTAATTVAPTATAASGVTAIKITSTGFEPQLDVVLPGTGIYWTNTDNVTHSIKAIGNNTGMFSSGDIIPNSGFGYTFSEKTGTFTYALDGNQSITGTIIVRSGRTLTG